MPLYQNSVLKKYLKQQDSEAVAKAFKKITKYFHDVLEILLKAFSITPSREG